MLFIIGLEMKPNLLWQMRRSIFGMGGLQLTVSALVIALATSLLGLAPKEGIAIGLILGLSSTAIVLQTLAEKNLMKQASGQAAFSVLLLQDIAVVPILAILPLLAIHPSAALLHGEEVRRIGGMEVTGWFQVLMILVIFTGIIIAVATWPGICSGSLHEPDSVKFLQPWPCCW